jgi:hypothetical protein
MKDKKDWIHGKGISHTNNPHGRPHVPYINVLNSALSKLAHEKGIHLVEKCVRDAYKNSAIAVAILRKIIPDISSSDVKLSQGQITINFIPKPSNANARTTENNKDVDSSILRNNERDK